MGKSKTRVIILVKNDLVTRANVHICRDLMDSQMQSVWLRFGPVSSSQITRAAERYARVVVHGDLNLDLDRFGDPLYARRNLQATLLESTEAAGLKTHHTPPTWHSYGLHRV
jgi:hypothetical protein